MKALLAFLVATLIFSPIAWAQTKPHARTETSKLGTTKTGKTGSALETKPNAKPKNLKLVPPWTMKLCPTELHATYDKAGAIKLRALDNDCWKWRQYFDEYFQMKKSYEKMGETTAKIVASFKKSGELDKKRIDSLMSQLKKEIEEKNTYKYKPTWGWLWAVGGGVALAIATGILIGTFATNSSD